MYCNDICIVMIYVFLHHYDVRSIKSEEQELIHYKYVCYYLLFDINTLWYIVGRKHCISNAYCDLLLLHPTPPPPQVWLVVKTLLTDSNR